MSLLQEEVTVVAATPVQRRRREDWEQSRTLLNMVRALMSRPTGDEVAQHLVLNLLSSHHPKSAVISLFGVDGALHAVGAFGVGPRSLETFKSMSLWDASPMADAIRANDMILLRTPDEVTGRYPWLGMKGRPAEPLAVAPLSLMNQQVGALQVTFAEAPDADLLYADLTGVTAVLALYLSLIRSNPAARVRPGHLQAAEVIPAPAPGTPSGGKLPAEEDEATQSLTDRQVEILRQMARGMTNAQIAKRIGFSESTVRQETMAIYRVFGVSGRREAVRMAAARGMLVSEAS